MASTTRTRRSGHGATGVGSIAAPTLFLNRRVGKSAKIYRADAPDARIVWQRPEAPLKKVEMLSRIPATSVQQASAGSSGS